MSARHGGDWKLLAEQVSKEMDSEKLLILVKELNRVLDEEYGTPDEPRRELGKP